MSAEEFDARAHFEKTGRAARPKTGADSQKEYKARMKAAGCNFLATWLEHQAALKLERLAVKHMLSKRDMLHKLISDGR